MTNERRKTLAEINHYCKTNLILVVRRDGNLSIMTCPIKAILIQNPETTTFIEEIKTNIELELLFIIKGKSYSSNEIVIL